MKLAFGVDPVTFRGRARMLVWVEDGDDGGNTVQFFSRLLAPVGGYAGVTVRAMAPTADPVAAAAAIARHTPGCAFILGRGSMDEAAAEQTWRRFPTGRDGAILVLPRKSWENEYLEPEWLAGSRYFDGDVNALYGRILERAAARLHIDIANHVLARLEQYLDGRRLPRLTADDEISSVETGVERLCGRPEWTEQVADTLVALSSERIEAAWREEVRRCLAGALWPRFGRGRWLEVIEARALLPELISGFFTVTDVGGRRLLGAERVLAVVEDLAGLASEQQPPVIRRLVRLFEERLIYTSEQKV